MRVRLSGDCSGRMQRGKRLLSTLSYIVVKRNALLGENFSKMKRGAPDTHGASPFARFGFDFDNDGAILNIFAASVLSRLTAPDIDFKRNPRREGTRPSFAKVFLIEARFRSDRLIELSRTLAPKQPAHVGDVLNGLMDETGG